MSDFTAVPHYCMLYIGYKKVNLIAAVIMSYFCPDSNL
jgi:hypothetical protein